MFGITFERYHRWLMGEMPQKDRVIMQKMFFYDSILFIAIFFALEYLSHSNYTTLITAILGIFWYIDVCHMSSAAKRGLLAEYFKGY